MQGVMPRLARLDAPGILHHVIIRGIERKNIFRDTNMTIKKILESSLGVKPKDYLDNISRFEEFCGLWTNKELSEFEKKTETLRRVDPEDWL